MSGRIFLPAEADENVIAILVLNVELDADCASILGLSQTLDTCIHRGFLFILEYKVFQCAHGTEKIKRFVKDMESNTVLCHNKELALQNSSVASVKRHWKFCVNKEISEIIEIAPIQLHGSNLLSMKVKEF